MEAPKSVTKEQIESRIVGVEFEKRGTMTLCFMKLVNGFEIVGTSACVDPAKYDQEIGERIARANAFDQIWPLEGYALANRLLFERDAETAARIDTLAAEADGVRVGCAVTCVATDDVERAKTLIRATLEAGPNDGLTQALALLTPETPPMVLFGTGIDDKDPFDDFLDRSIDDIVPDLDGLSVRELADVLKLESGGKTRKGLVKAIGDELARRGTESE